MLNPKEISLQKLIAHKVGNKIQEEPLQLSNQSIEITDENLEKTLLSYFLSTFKFDTFFHFHHESNLSFNEVYSHVKAIFDDPESFEEKSQHIARHLYDAAHYPAIKGGEMYLAYFKDCMFEDEIADAIGIFKSEQRETYLKVEPAANATDAFKIWQDEGIRTKKLDKGCLIFNTETDLGYKAVIVDQTNPNQETSYWKTHFLQLKPREDSFYHTANYLDMCKGFVEEVFNEDHQVEKPEQISMMNRTSEYFKKKESFNAQEFEQEVMQEPEVIDAFRGYKEQYVAERQVPDYPEFDISAPAVKQKNKMFKAVLKLDKNFHVYVHGNQEKIEKGYDEERGEHFYKLYFKEES